LYHYTLGRRQRARAVAGLGMEKPAAAAPAKLGKRGPLLPDEMFAR
jgi:hypothetical protein